MDLKIKQEISRPLSFEELIRIMNNATGIDKVKIIELNSQCRSKLSIDEILDRNHDMAIVYLPVMSKYNGHFTCIFQSPDENTCFWFDSYGNSPSQIIDIINDMGHVVDKKCLFVQMRKKYKQGIMSCVDYQSQSPSVSDCGRWSCAVLIVYDMYKKQGKGDTYSFLEFYKFVKGLQNQYKNNDMDYCITRFTEQYLKE